jgi:preprotein translocase subunit Sec63
MENKTNFLIKLDETQYQTPDITKKGIAAAAMNIYVAIMEGNMAATDIAVMLKFVEETGKQLKELTDDNGKNSFVDLVREEVERSSDDGKTYHTKHGVKFELYEAATKFGYESCGDPVWNRLSKESELIKMKMKERESFLKTIKGSTTMNVMDPDTAELHENVQLFSPAKSSTSTYKQTMING